MFGVGKENKRNTIYLLKLRKPGPRFVMPLFPELFMVVVGGEMDQRLR